ncbi:MAG: hypothetical protein ABH872_05640 [Candidatus Omnitrophota bacterium]
MRNFARNNLKKTVKLVLISIFILIAMPVFIFAAEVTNDSVVDEVLKITGTQKVAEDMTQIINIQLKQRKDKLSPDIYDKIAGVMNEVFSAESFYRAVKKNMLESMDAASFKDMLEIIENPLTQNMRELARIAADPGSKEGLIEFSKQIAANPLDSSRIDLVQRLNDTLGISKITVEQQILSFRAIALTINALAPSGKQLDTSQIEDLEASNREKLRPFFSKQFLIASLYAYQTVSDDQLNEYRALFDNQTVKKFNESFLDALAMAVLASSEQVNSRLLKEFSQQDAPDACADSTQPVTEDKSGDRIEISKESIEKNMPFYPKSLKEFIKKAEENIIEIDKQVRKQRELTAHDDNEKSAKELFESANVIFEEGNVNDARDKWKQALKLTKDKQLKSSIKRRDKEARKKLEEIKRKDKEEAYVNRRHTAKLYKEAVSLFKAKDFHKSREKFKIIEEINPGYRKTQHYLKLIDSRIESSNRAD